MSRNPVQNVLSLDVQWPAAGHGEIGLYDLSGRRQKEVFRGRAAATGAHLAVGVEGMPPGVYFVRGTCNDACTVTRIVVVH
jgi:hypothetical protein